jgi:hypothetical protein
MEGVTHNVTRIWDWIDTRSIVRRIVLFVTLWMTWRSFTWAADYANHLSLTPGIGLEAAAIIAAVTAPIAALQASVFKIYSDGRKEG